MNCTNTCCTAEAQFTVLPTIMIIAYSSDAVCTLQIHAIGVPFVRVKYTRLAYGLNRNTPRLSKKWSCRNFVNV